MKIIRLEFIRSRLSNNEYFFYSECMQAYSFQFILSDGYSIVSSNITKENRPYLSKLWSLRKISTLRFNYFYIRRPGFEVRPVLQKEIIYPHQGFTFSKEQINKFKFSYINIVEEDKFTEEELRKLLLDIPKLFS